MKVFDEFRRTDKSLKRRNESLFDFYNRCARKPFAIVRRMLQTWVDDYELHDRRQLVSRFRNRDDHVFYSTLAEVLSFRLLTCLGHKLTIHPKLTNGKKIDFLVVDEKDNREFFVEVTVRGKTQKAAGLDKIENELYDAINSIDLPPHQRLGLQVLKRGKSSPKKNHIRKEIRAWALKHQHLRSGIFVDQKDFESAGWKIRLELFSGFKQEPKLGSIAGELGRLRELSGGPSIT